MKKATITAPCMQGNKGRRRVQANRTHAHVNSHRTRPPRFPSVAVGAARRPIGLASSSWVAEQTGPLGPASPVASGRCATLPSSECVSY